MDMRKPQLHLLLSTHASCVAIHAHVCACVCVCVCPQDYLETKRIAFPRFYFVAPADLLDILSKGSNPQLILRHLPKCFDNTHNLSFKKDERGEPTKIALGMYSGTHTSQAKHLIRRTHAACVSAVPPSHALS